MSSGYEDERGYWEERIRSQDRYAGVGIQSLQHNVNRYRKEALFEVIRHVLEEQRQDLRGCRVLGTVSDTDLEDLQKKAAKLGGNRVLLTPERKAKGGYFGVQDLMTADVYSCGGTG